jgi:(p)ppGpp synthase/HD superfamily hydrolase
MAEPIMTAQGFSSLYLGDRFLRAVQYARDLHVEDRKGTDIPYMAHLLGVASLVMGECGHVQFPITEDEVIGALLHDAAEDWGGRPRLRDIERNFGSTVARHVEGCTDTFEDPKPDWKPRKQAYLDRLPNEPPATRLISAADKLYNARAILEDFRCVKHELWKRFKVGRDEQMWYFRELVRVFEEAGANRTVIELRRVVDQLVNETAVK